MKNARPRRPGDRPPPRHRKSPAWLVLVAGFTAAAAAILAPSAASAIALRPCPPGMQDTILDPLIESTSNLDDGSYHVDAAVVSQVFPNGIPFIQTYTDFWVNVNGNLSFGQSVSTYTPDAIPGLTIPTIAGYFADVDLRGNQGDLHMCIDTDAQQLIFTWDQVGYYSQKTDKLNSFQIVLTNNDQSVCGAAATFNIEFRYEQLEWTTGDASNGVGGLGGTPATAGIDAGDTINAVALPNSHTGQVLDLVNLSNVNEDGRFAFLVAAGTLPACGNGTLDLCEVCDDGNQSNDDGCTNFCQLPTCGDGFVHTGFEDCDLAAVDPNATCPSGYMGQPMCNNDPANPIGDGTCTVSAYGCTDLDECSDPALNDCSADATCTNTDGSYVCKCKKGFSGDGVTCADVNECATPGLNNCSVNATCANTVGGFTCTCKPLYTGNGVVCTPVDSDGDGLSDVIELQIGSNPNDQDSDDDGVIDGLEPNPGGDADNDGIPNVLDPDADNDGLFDGTELGFDCSNPDTDLGAGHCVADADMGLTKTDPTKADTDGGGANDGSEDVNGNGAVDPGETNPAGSGDDGAVLDSDGDGLSDQLEILQGSNPTDGDSDDDGVLDGLEVNPTLDSDGDGLLNMLDPDSDNDGIFDGTEMGKNRLLGDTDPAAGHCVADGDAGATKTSPVKADTDGGGAKDGAEDANHNGVLDPGELDPTVGHAADDVMLVDSDNDGLSDPEEIAIGSDPTDNDSDDDGVVDGKEQNPAADDDGDGLVNAADWDSDNDGLYDGTELGFGCPVPGMAHCIPDGDLGATKTNPNKADTDDGGVKDGAEDKNHNGVIDAGETDPNDGSDDLCLQTPDCALGTQVCDSSISKCVDAKCDANTPCPAADICHFAGVCNPASGVCTYPNKADGAMCSDNNVCTADACVAGVCQSFSVLDFTPCTENDQPGLCIAGHCLTDSGVGGASTGGAGGGTTTGSGGATGGGSTTSTTGGGGGAGGDTSTTGAGAGSGETSDKFSLFGGGCTTSSGAPSRTGEALSFLAIALAFARRRRSRAA
ncbi:MAG: EGF domain-containing protein [Polyangiaceae bacterium]